MQHSLIKAVGFTDALRGGRALFDLCAARPEPIPFFGELGSVNPMFLLPGALSARGEEIGKGWAASLTMGADKFRTNPGLAILPEGPDAEWFFAASADALSQVAAQAMLMDGVRDAFCDGRDGMTAANWVTTVIASAAEGRTASPHLLEDDR